MRPKEAWRTTFSIAETNPWWTPADLAGKLKGKTSDVPLSGPRALAFSLIARATGKHWLFYSSFDCSLTTFSTAIHGRERFGA